MRGLFLMLALVLSAGLSRAADQPIYAPPEAWVKPHEPANPIGPDTNTPTRILLADSQIRFDGGAREAYAETLVKIQTSQGLFGVGNLMLAWKPDTDTLTIHKLHIIRGDQVIDLLANGRTFLVLRRENNLEMAMLDGALTAAIQPEGLQVGDMLDLAVTTKQIDPVLQGHAESLMGNLIINPIDRLIYREVWPKTETLRFRQTDGLAAAKITPTVDGSELTIAMDKAEPAKAPKGAPARYFELGEIEGTDFRSWAEVSALMAPLFEKASTLAPASPVTAEAAKIKAASTDPKVQAMAALKLVEDQVRYLFLGMNNGGYVPADADQTWSRRFGDCKGKTALLIALLHELGIEAEPALASVMHGDGLDEHLPMLEVFDHVLVRVVIGGKVYWLDGTRSGDRTLDDLPVPVFHWLLPVQKSGAELVKLTIPMPEKPLADTDIQIDASAGIDSQVKVRAATVFRADPGIFLNLRLKSITPENLDKALRDYWKKALDWVDIAKVAASYDEKTGEELLTLEGTGKMEWKNYLGDGGTEYQVDGSTLGWHADFDRELGSKADAPFLVTFPMFNLMKETIKLPNKGEGFSIDATDQDKTAAGIAFKRTTKIENGALTMVASVKSLLPEFPAADSAQAKKDLRMLSDVAVYLKALKALPHATNDASLSDGKIPTTAEGFTVRGAMFHEAGRYDAAIADFTHALTLEPSSMMAAEAYADRGLAYLSKDMVAEAQADFDRAFGLNAQSEPALRGSGILLVRQSKFDAALDRLSRAIAIEPDDAWALLWRGLAYSALNKSGLALTDYDETLKLKPDLAEAYRSRAFTLVFLQRGQEALADIDKALTFFPSDRQLHGLRARALLLLNHKAQAEKEFVLMMPKPASANDYLSRARMRDMSDVEGTTADIDTVLRLKPASPEALNFKINIEVETGDPKGAAALLDHAIAVNPDNLEFLRRRAILRADNRQFALAIRDFDQIVSKQPDSPDTLGDACRIKALAVKNFDSALATCSALVKLAPDSDEAKEARGFAYLRFGHYDEAKADYDDVLVRRPNSPTALFGRGLAEAKAGTTGSGEADLAAARAKNPSIDADFVAFRPVPASQFDGAIELAWVQPPPATAQDFIGRGLMRLDGHRNDLAIVDFTMALKRDSRSGAAHAGRGMAYLRMGATDEAAADFEKALTLDANDAMALKGQGLIAARKGDSTTAIQLLTRTIELKPDDTDARSIRAATLAGAQRYDEALQDMNLLISKTPNNAVWLNARCWYRAIAGKELSDALADCDASLKIQDMVATRDSRGMVDLRLGKFDDAVADYDKALMRQPNIASALYGRGIAKTRKGVATEGRADMAAALAIDPKVETKFASYGVTP